MPIGVRIIGTDYDDVRKHAEKIAAEMKRIPYLRDVSFEQTLDYPTVEVDIDREMAGLIGITPEACEAYAGHGDLLNPFHQPQLLDQLKTGFDYLVQIQVPPLRMDKPEDVEELPLEAVNPLVPLMVRDVVKDGQVRTSMRPGEYDRDMSQRYLTVIANVEGEDMGRASQQVRQAIQQAGEPPRGVRVEETGPNPADDQDVQGAGDRTGGRRVRHSRPLDGLFPIAAPWPWSPSGPCRESSPVSPSSSTSPKTTLNIESFMGSIMCLGVSVSNSVMMVAFMDEHWKAGKPSTRGGPSWAHANVCGRS